MIKIDLDKTIDFMLLEPSQASRGRLYSTSVNGESVITLYPRIDLKTNLMKKFPNSEKIALCLETFKTFLIDFEDGSVEILTKEIKEKITTTKTLTESDIKRSLNKDENIKEMTSMEKMIHTASTRMSSLLKKTVTMSNGDKLWMQDY